MLHWYLLLLLFARRDMQVSYVLISPDTLIFKKYDLLPVSNKNLDLITSWLLRHILRSAMNELLPPKVEKAVGHTNLPPPLNACFRTNLNLLDIGYRWRSGMVQPDETLIG